MCGIVGTVAGAVPNGHNLGPQLRALLQLSETRGSEAAGLAVLTSSAMQVVKSAQSASSFTRSEPFRSALAVPPSDRFLAAIGHTRLVTNGSAIYANNNQPVEQPGYAMVHNGIITNPEVLWDRAGTAEDDRPEVDSAALLAFIAASVTEPGATLEDGVAAAFANLNGAASIALTCAEAEQLVLATNVGSLYIGVDADGRLVVFGSERHIVAEFAKDRRAAALPPITEVFHLAAGEAVSVDMTTAEIRPFALPPYQSRADGHPSSAPRVAQAAGDDGAEPSWRRPLRRCSRCILPETFPFITFDHNGVCRECTHYEPVSVGGDEALERALAPYRSTDGSPDCILAFSGGRDSAYGMHRLVKDFGMTPLALTYDWGMVTDLARRNQARMCGALGVEHILISANLAAKRRNIALNLKAWLRKPDLGLVPLLMAGDKHFFIHSQQLAKRAGVKLVVFCTNPLEMTYFKTGFAGVRDQRYYTGGLGNKLRLAAHYGKGFVTNPGYLNRSLLDTAGAFRASYFTRHDYVQLFEHLDWQEDKINELLLERYAWETDPSTPTTWRIGDGTAPFYNWVYYEAVGFTENDTFRSNQIREGEITRERALELVAAENSSRWDRIQEYLDLLEVPIADARDGVARLVASLENSQLP